MVYYLKKHRDYEKELECAFCAGLLCSVFSSEYGMEARGQNNLNLISECTLVKLPNPHQAKQWNLEIATQFKEL